MMHKYRDETEFQFRPYLQPLDDIHLHSAGVLFADQFHTNNNKIIYSLVVIAVFILLIACFNFINLNTAGALARAKETGVQKVLGATQFQLISKFFSESFLLCAFSLLVALVLVALALRFNALAGVSLSPASLLLPELVFALTALLFIVSMIAGVYPSVFLARFKSTDVFRNIIKAGRDSWLQNH